MHHRVYPNPSNGEAAGDWAADLQSVQPGDPVVLYAAPPDGQSTDVTATVQAVGPACASGDLSAGGSRVTVELSSPTGPIGTVTYAHVQPLVNTGDVIKRWDTQIGTVGSYTPGSCWDGAHVHVELSSQSNYACYNGTFAAGQAVQATNFIGFLGGSYATTTGQACP